MRMRLSPTPVSRVTKVEPNRSMEARASFLDWIAADAPHEDLPTAEPRDGTPQDSTIQGHSIPKPVPDGWD